MRPNEKLHPTDLTELHKSFMGATKQSALLMWKGVVEDWIAANPAEGCLLRRVPLKVFQAAAIPMRMGSELRRVVDMQLGLMREGGENPLFADRGIKELMYRGAEIKRTIFNSIFF